MKKNTPNAAAEKTRSKSPLSGSVRSTKPLRPHTTQVIAHTREEGGAQAQVRELVQQRRPDDARETEGQYGESHQPPRRFDPFAIFARTLLGRSFGA